MIVNDLIYLHGIILILITFYEFGDVKDLTFIKFIIQSGVSDSHFLLELCTV